jgi:hypothetical protein
VDLIIFRIFWGLRENLPILSSPCAKAKRDSDQFPKFPSTWKFGPLWKGGEANKPHPLSLQDEKGFYFLENFSGGVLS